MLFDGYWLIIFCVVDVTLTAELKSNAVCPSGCICESFRKVNCSGAVLSDASFERIPLQVEELNLSNNNLRSIPQALQVQYTEIVSLNLSTNRIAFIARNSFSRMPKIKTLDLSHNLIKSLSDIEAGILFTANTRLQTLNLSGNAITDLGDGYDQIFYSESLLHLDVSWCSIAHFQGPIILQGLPRLVRLNLAKNPITRIDGLTSDSLQVLDVRDCNLHFLRYDTFDKLPRLKEAYLSDNRHLTDQTVRPASGSVTRVDASYCSIHSNYAADLVASQTVLLKGNLLTEIAPRAFRNNSKLEYLDLSDNRIRHVHELAFLGAKSLRSVDLSGNRLSTLAANTFAHTSLLEALHLSANLFATIPPLNSSSLQRLDLSDCRIDDIAQDAISLLTSLRVLNVSENWLVRFAPRQLISSSLQTLDVSYCRLASIHESSLATLTHLREINLAGNRLVYAKLKTFIDSPLERIWLAENPWICDCTDADFRALWQYLAAEPSKLAGGGAPRCQHPENVTDRLWKDACYTQWNTEQRKSKDIVVLIIIVTVLLISGIVACVVAVKESWKIRHSRRAADEEHGRDRRNDEDDPTVQSITSENDSTIRESIRKFTQLPSYDEALLLPKPAPSSSSADETTTPSSNVRQTVIRLEMSKKRQSATQTDETIDALLREIAQQQDEESAGPAPRRQSIQEMQYINIKPLPVQCTEL